MSVSPSLRRQVFPYLRKRFGFHNIATLCGNWYMPIFTWQKPVDNERMHADRFKWKCDLMSSPDTNHEEECDQVPLTVAAAGVTAVPVVVIGVLLLPCVVVRTRKIWLCVGGCPSCNVMTIATVRVCWCGLLC